MDIDEKNANKSWKNPGVTKRNTKKYEKQEEKKKESKREKKSFSELFEFVQSSFKKITGQHTLPKFTLTDLFLISILTVFAVITYIYKIYQPDKIVFDEVYFGNFSKFYNTGEYFFDIHPPLAKLILGFAGYLADMDLNFSYSEIGNAYTTFDYVVLRSTNALFGAMKSPLLYITARICGASPSWSFLCGFMPAVDNAFIVESRHILTDGILTFFVTLSIAAIAIVATEQYFWRATLFVAVSCAFAACTKFTAGGIYIAVAITYLIHFPFYKTVIAGFIIVVVFVFVLFATFGIHFYLLPNPGEGCEYHGEGYCDNLKDFVVIPDTLELINIMLSSNFGITDEEGEQSSASKWYQWPFMAGHAVFMYIDPDYDDTQLWCIGTPTVWYAALIGLIAFTTFFCMRNPKVVQSYWLIAGYLASYLPMGLINRPIYNYHYLIPLLFTFVMAAIAGDVCFGSSWIIPLVVCGIQAATYVYFSPLTYALPLDEDDLNDRFWFSCWKN